MTIVNHEAYVSLEVAKLLKEAGFDWDVQSYYSKLSRNQGRLLWLSCGCRYKENININQNRYSAPTLDVAQKWLREVYQLHITIFSSSQESWMFRITKPHQMLEDGIYGEDFYTYEEVQEAGIKKALEIILEKGEYENN